jgi:hypothetical protein
MRMYNRYVLTVALLLLLTATILVATGQNSLSVYYTAYVIEAFVVTELYAYFNNNARRGLALVSTVLFGGFVLIIFFQVIKMLA